MGEKFMVRHKTFISYHHKNEQNEKNRIVEEFKDEDFIDASVNEGDINTDLSEDKIMRKIRDDYLKDSSVTLVLIGRETAKRPFINSEIQASLWGDNPNGLLAVVTDDLYEDIYDISICKCGNKVRSPKEHDVYLPDLVRKNREIERNKDRENECHYSDSELYCSLISFSQFLEDPDYYIHEAYVKREELDYKIAKKLDESTPKIQKNILSDLAY